MPEGLQITERHQDPYAWALAQAALLRRGAPGRRAIDASELCEFLEEWAEEMLAAARSQMVNLMAHATKVALSRNPGIVGHWRSECIELMHERAAQELSPKMGRMGAEDPSTASGCDSIMRAAGPRNR